MRAAAPTSGGSTPGGVLAQEKQVLGLRGLRAQKMG